MPSACTAMAEASLPLDHNAPSPASLDRPTHRWQVARSLESTAAAMMQSCRRAVSSCSRRVLGRADPLQQLLLPLCTAARISHQSFGTDA